MKYVVVKVIMVHSTVGELVYGQKHYKSTTIVFDVALGNKVLFTCWRDDNGDFNFCYRRN
jgi:hypothetical protein